MYVYIYIYKLISPFGRVSQHVGRPPGLGDEAGGLPRKTDEEKTTIAAAFGFQSFAIHHG
jgi:hypothetical protein